MDFSRWLTTFLTVRGRSFRTRWLQNRWKFPTPIPIKNNVRHFEVPTLILEQVREHCEKGKGRLSVHFPEMAEIYSSAAENIMSRDLEISAEMDTETLRGWVEEIKVLKNLKSLIREHL